MAIVLLGHYAVALILRWRLIGSMGLDGPHAYVVVLVEWQKRESQYCCEEERTSVAHFDI